MGSLLETNAGRGASQPYRRSVRPAASVLRTLGVGRDGIGACARAALVAAARGEVAADVVPRHELESGVGVGRRHETARVAAEKELLDRQQALQVGLLVDREVEPARGDRLERPWQDAIKDIVTALILLAAVTLDTLSKKRLASLRPLAGEQRDLRGRRRPPGQPAVIDDLAAAAAARA